tara:strand:+ start:451 stop:1746 length:1296 start_codon:yes stop_codon:yes gene_type:complete
MKGTKCDSPIFFGWYIVATCFFIAFLTVGVRNAFGIFVIPMSEEFGWTRTTISLAAASGFLINGITQPFLGHLFDRIGGRRVIVVGLVLIGIFTLLLSLTFHILFMLVVFSFLLSTALSGPSLTNTMALISKWFKRRRATAISINTVGTSIGGLILVPFAMYFLQATGWRMTWLILGLLILLLAVPLALLFIRENPEALGLLPDGDKEYQEQAEYEKREDRLGEFEVDHWIKSFRSAPMWQLSAAYVVCGVTTGMISTHFVPFAIERGISPGKAALIFGLMMGLNSLGGIGAGVLSDKFGRKNVLAAVYLLRGIGYVMLVCIPSSLGMWAFAIAAGFSWVASVPLTSALTADVYGLRVLATISGITFLCHQVGSFIMVLLAGVLFDLTGSYTLPFAIAGSLLFPAALAAYTIKEKRYSIRYRARREEVVTY